MVKQPNNSSLLSLVYIIGHKIKPLHVSNDKKKAGAKMEGISKNRAVWG